MPRNIKQKIKENIKPVSKKIAAGVAIGGITIGSGLAYKNVADKKAFLEAHKKAIELKKSNGFYDKFSADTVIEYNKSAKPNEIFYFNGKDISVLRLSSGLTKPKLGQIYNLLPEQSKRIISELIDQKVSAVNKELKTNPVLRKKILSRVKILDYRLYLLSLPLEKVEIIFRKELNSSNFSKEIRNIHPQVLESLKADLAKSQEGSIVTSALAAFFMSAIAAQVFGKKKESPDFH